jgi:SAM-dependent methyltransferase
VELDMGDILDKFIGYLPESGEIMDLGCGSGRDSLYLIDRGFGVTAVDGSKEMCELASIHIGQDILEMQFSELDFDEVFDGIWACASLLHTTPDEFEDIFGKVIKCLKPGGVLYMSFKYGEFTGFRNGRYFNDFKTKEMKDIINRFSELELIDIWKTPDVRNERGEEDWLNVLVKKIDDEEQV